MLPGAHVDRFNNYNPLVTVHFNTPVTSARLVPHGQDLWFVIDLRANVQPTVAMDAAKDGAAMMRIEFPKGEYLQAREAGSDQLRLPYRRISGRAYFLQCRARIDRPASQPPLRNRAPRRHRGTNPSGSPPEN